jgi:hypothetical protein
MYTERENLIKKLADKHLEAADGGLVINVGSNHGQKHSFMGTKQEWLAEYLADRSPYGKDNTYSLLVIPAKGTLENMKKPVNLGDTFFKNELFNVTAVYAAENRAFLSFDDDSFKNKRMLLNFHYQKISVQPKRLYDGVIILPQGTYVNSLAN